MFGWGATELGYYITVAASCRALWLLVLLPMVIKILKPKVPKMPTTASQNLFPPIPATPAQRRAHLLPTIEFDIRVARISLFVDTISFILTCVTSSPLGFVLSTSMSSLGGGMVPACQSLALSLIDVAPGDVGGMTGAMFGAISVLQATGQNILGPLLFGALYASTVRSFPKMIFVAGAVLLATSLFFLCFVAPHNKIPAALRVKKQQQQSGKKLLGDVGEGLSATGSGSGAAAGRRRGRSRTAKDLRRSSDVGQIGREFDEAGDEDEDDGMAGSRSAPP